MTVFAHRQGVEATAMFSVFFALAALAALGHLAGVLYQRPRILLVLGVVEAAVIWGLVRALRGRAMAGREASKDAAGVAAGA